MDKSMAELTTSRRERDIQKLGKQRRNHTVTRMHIRTFMRSYTEIQNQQKQKHKLQKQFGIRNSEGDLRFFNEKKQNTMGLSTSTQRRAKK